MKLSSVIDNVITGDWGSEVYSEQTPCGVHCIRSADIVPYYNSVFDSVPIRYISENSFNTRQLHEGDIVIEKSGGTNECSTGRTMYVSKELLEANPLLVCSNFCSAFRVKEGWDSRFIYYFLRLVHSKGVFHNFEGKTSGIHNLQMEAAFDVIELPNLTLDEQIKAANLLSDIDSKLANNRKQNTILEKIAKQIYDYWFVQFDFPDENGKPYRSSGGKMVWNEQLKRDIPYGWEVKSISSFVSKQNGDWGEELPSNKNNIKVLCARGADIIEMTNLPTRYISESHLNRLMKTGDIMVEISGGSPVQATGRCAYISNGVLKRLGSNLVCSNFCQVVRVSKYNMSSYLYYFWDLLYRNGNMFNFEGKTSGIKNFQMDTFLQTKWCIPPEPILNCFQASIDNLIEQKELNKSETSSLQSLHSYLLPLLMTGQVKLK